MTMFYLIKNESEIIDESDKKGQLRKVYKKMSEEDKVIHKVSKFAPTGKKLKKVAKKVKDLFDDLLSDDDEEEELPTEVLSKKELRKLKRQNSKKLRTMNLYDKVPTMLYAK